MCDPVAVGITSTVIGGGLKIGGMASEYQQAKSNVAFANAQADMDYFQTQLDVDAANRQAQRQYFQAQQEEALNYWKEVIFSFWTKHDYLIFSQSIIIESKIYILSDTGTLKC